MLSSNRAVIVTGELRTMRQKRDSKSFPVAQVEGTVVGSLLECPEDSIWCRIEIDGFKGWLRKMEFWGVYKKEILR